MNLPQLIEGLPNADYHAHPAISKSGLDRLAKSPAHYKWYKENGTEETPALVFGRAFHTMILEPEKGADEIVVLPDSWLTKKECGISIEDQKEDFRHKHQHKAILTADQMEMALAMEKAVNDHAAARFLLRKSPGKAESSLFWKDEDTGMDCRARFDWLRDDGLIIDLKTTRCASPEVFDRLAYEHRYHVQAAFYMEAYRRVLGREPAGFAFVAVEKEPPYCVCVYLAQPEFVKLGRQQYLRDLMNYADCVQKNEWPGYPDISLVPLNLPAWAQRQLNQGESL